MRKIAICDDESVEREQLSNILQSTSFAPIEPYCFESGESILFEYNRGQSDFELVFLDIYMDGMNGMETARALRSQGYRGAIVFLTTSKDFAVESYEVEAFDYLIKPPSKERVEKLLYKLFSQTERPSICLLVEREKRYIYLDEIAYFESRNHDVLVHLVSGETLRTRGKLADLGQALDDSRFLECHKSFLVNMQEICDVKEGFVLKNGEAVPIRVRERSTITETYYRYFVSSTVKTWRG